MRSAAAFFDVDRTLVVGTSLEACFLQQARKHKLIGPLALWQNVPAALRALGLLPFGQGQRIVIPPDLPLKTRLRYALLSGNKTYLRGLPLDRCLTLADETFRDKVLPRLSQRGQEIARWHQAEGRPVVLLTGTLDFLGEPLQRYLKADHLMAARPEVHDGRLTGRLIGAHPYGRRKRQILLQYAQQQDIDLPSSFAYADHHTDVPFLETVGFPTAVNPDAELAQTAQERGWAIEQF